MENRYTQGEQRLAQTRTNLAVSERERNLLTARLSQTESQLSDLATAKQLLAQDNAVLSSQLAELRAKGGGRLEHDQEGHQPLP